MIFKLNSYIPNNRALLHTTSKIREGMKMQCFHGFRSFKNMKYIFKRLLQTNKKAL